MKHYDSLDGEKLAIQYPTKLHSCLSKSSYDYLQTKIQAVF